MSILFLPILLAAGVDEGPAFWFGATLIPIALLAGIVKCVTISRRDITSSRCVLGLAFVILGVLLFALSGFAEVLGAETSDEFPLVPLIGFGSIFVGTAVALLGLIEYSNIKPPLRQGRRQAATAMLIGGGLLGYVVYVTVSSADFESALEQSPLSGLGHTEPQTFEDLNLHFDAPPFGWIRLDPHTLSENACIGYSKLDGEVYFMLIAESLGAELEFTPDDLLAIAVKNLKNAALAPRISKPEVVRHAGLEGRMVRSEANIDGDRFCYNHRVFVHNGFAYQLVTFAEAGHRKAVEKAARTMLGLFRAIDPNRIASGDETNMLSDYESPRLGYAVDLADRKWFTSDALKEAYTVEDLVVVYRNACWLSVVAIKLPDNAVADRALLRGMLSLKNYSYPAESIADLTVADVEGRRELTFGYQHGAEGARYHTLVRLVLCNGFAYLVAAGREKSGPIPPEFLSSALRRVRFASPTSEPAPTQVAARENLARARCYNQIGLQYYVEENLERAKFWFLAACDVPGTTESYVGNASRVLIEMERNREALLHLNRHLRVIEENLDLRGDRAWLLALAGQEEEAHTEYAELFANGHRDADDLEYYAGMLVRAKKPESAIQLIKRYRKVKDGPLLVAIHADVLVSVGQAKLARKILQTQAEPHPARILLAFLDVYEATKEPAKALATANALLDGDIPWLRAYQGKARAEIALGRHDNAAKTVQQGLERFEADEVLEALAIEAGAAKKK